jgi:hypothetical protein
MKLRSCSGWILCTAAVLLTGCAGIPALIVKDTTSRSDARSAAEFYTTNFAGHRAPFDPNCQSGIWMYDAKGKKTAMGAIGYQTGARPGMIVIGDFAERIRVIVPPGTHKFRVGDNKDIEVETFLNKLTPVEVNGHRSPAVYVSPWLGFSWDAIIHPPVPLPGTNSP